MSGGKQHDGDDLLDHRSVDLVQVAKEAAELGEVLGGLELEDVCADAVL